MRKLRFTISSLLAIILVLGVGFAALRESSDLWESGVFTVTLGILLISILLAVHCHESKRAFWLGFAVCGWIYTGLTLVPSIETRLLTTKALAYLDSKVPGRPLGVFTLRLSVANSSVPTNQVQAVAFSQNGNQLATSNQGVVRLWDVATGKLLNGWSGTTYNFVRIGHSLFALLVGWLGGQLSRRLCQASRHTEGPTAIEVGGGTS
jgi:WD40 repeat protein